MKKLLLLITFLSTTIVANPQNLEKWSDWLTDSLKEEQVPSLYNNYSKTVSLWKSPLKISVNSRGGKFSQTITIFEESLWVNLPGSKQWPKDVKDSRGKKLVVVKRASAPSLLLERGSHIISGKFSWSKLPQTLTIPNDNTILNFTRNSKKVENPLIRGNLLSLLEAKKRSTLQEESNSIRIKVFRHLDDEIPQILTTKLKIVVTGKTRDSELGRVISQDFELISITSPIPAVVSKDGTLRVELKTGVWEIDVKARAKGIFNSFTTTAGGNEWPKQELWSFQERNSMRVVSLSGVSQVDPSQTDMPRVWHSLPAYLINWDDTLKLNEKGRGDQTPTPNSFSLTREFHLDFDGKGFTVEDKMNGRVNEATQLSMTEPFELGKATLNGKPHLVVKTEFGSGVGLSTGNINLSTISRVKEGSVVPVSGWSVPQKSVSSTLNLPPGWELFHISGVDSVGRSVVSSWSLWEIFLALLLLVLLFKTFGTLWAFIGGTAILLLFHTTGSPQIFWLAILITTSVLKIVPQNSFRNILRFVYAAFMIILVWMVIPLSIKTVRTVFYPQLKQSKGVSDYYEVMDSDNSRRVLLEKEIKIAKDKTSMPQNKMALQRSLAMEITSDASYGSSAESFNQSSSYSQNLRKYSQTENLQTGPGKPSWSWDRYYFTSDSEVEPTAKLKFYLISPIFMRFANLLAVVSLVALTLRLLYLLKEVPQFKKGEKEMKTISSSILILMFLLAPANLQAQTDYPPKYLFDKIEKNVKEELAKKPLCFPKCAEIESGKVIVKNEKVVAKFTILAQEETVLPFLSLNQGSWTPQEISVNGKESFAKVDGSIALLLKQGVNSVIFRGPVLNNQISLTFPTALHNFSVDAPAWSVTGVKDGQLPGKMVQLRKTEVKKIASNSSVGTQPDVESFVIINRQFSIGDEQQVYTSVVRKAPLNRPLTVKVKLLEKEALLTADITVKDGIATIEIPANRNSVNFRSRFPMVSSLFLESKNSSSQVETWSFSVEPRYKVNFSGLLPVKTTGVTAQKIWKPRKGDSLNVVINKSKAMVGKTTTVESAKVEVVGGKRSSRCILNLQVNSSMGEAMTVYLTDKSVVEKLSVDGREQTISKEGSVVKVPLHPGIQKVVLEWKDTTKISILEKTQEIKLSTDVSNISINYRVPRSRWIIALGGPLLGPAMLIWGILSVFILFAFLLPKVTQTPLNIVSWIFLFLGVSSIHYLGGVPLILWFVVISYRKKYEGSVESVGFSWMQIGIVLVTLFALCSLAISIPVGLLSSPNMHITGNGSSAYNFFWYQDRSSLTLPQGWFLSFPIWVYRGVMLLWSVWIAANISKWVKWSWDGFSYRGLWPKKKVKDNNNEK
jgi:hypothetical protein